MHVQMNQKMNQKSNIYLALVDVKGKLHREITLCT